MIRVEEYRQFGQSEWRELVIRLGGNVFHLPEVWLVGNDPTSVGYLVVKMGGETVAACVYVSQEKRFLKLFKSSMALYLPTPLAISKENGAKENDIYDALLRFAAKSGYEMLRIGLRWGVDFLGNPQLGRFVDQHLIEFTIDLRNDIDDITRSCHKKHRKNIRKAGQSQISIITDNTLDGFFELKRLQEASSIKSCARGNVYQLPNDEFYIESHKNIYQNGLGSVMFAKKDEMPVAGLAYLFFGDKAVTVRSGATKEGYSASAPYLLQFRLLQQLKEDGYTALNIGGVPKDAVESSHPQHGLYQFKKGFGAIANLRTALTIPLR